MKLTSNDEGIFPYSSSPYPLGCDPELDDITPLALDMTGKPGIDAEYETTANLPEAHMLPSMNQKNH
jgi:hypothetical protein